MHCEVGYGAASDEIVLTRHENIIKTYHSFVEGLVVKPRRRLCDMGLRASGLQTFHSMRQSLRCVVPVVPGTVNNEHSKA